MSILITAIVIGSALLAFYWIFHGQGKYNDMFRSKRKTELKAVLFDMDGVIIDSFDAWFSVFNQLRKKHNLEEMSKEEFKKKAWGIIANDKVKELFNNENPTKIFNEYQTLIKKYINKIKLLDNAEKVLQTIKKKNIKIGIVTNNFTKPTLKILKHHKIKHYFDAIVTTEDVEKPKPHPEAVLKLCEKLKVSPDETILVGDTPNDYKAGKSAGCFVVGLNTHGDLIISKLTDLLKLV